MRPAKLAGLAALRRAKGTAHRHDSSFCPGTAHGLPGACSPKVRFTARRTGHTG